jgi:hypothetical protein
MLAGEKPVALVVPLDCHRSKSFFVGNSVVEAKQEFTEF